MSYLYRVSIDFSKAWEYNGSKDPVYVVAESKEDAKEMVGSRLKHGSIKSVAVLGKQLSHRIFRGK